jgi:DNA-directed RNA polymerase subunit F
MIGREVIKEREVSLPEVKSMLEKRKKDEELSYEQKASYEYAKSQAKSGIRKTQQLVEELVKIGKIDEQTAVMIADNHPQDKDDLNTLLEKKRHGLTETEAKKVLDLVAKHE